MCAVTWKSCFFFLINSFYLSLTTKNVFSLINNSWNIKNMKNFQSFIIIIYLVKRLLFSVIFVGIVLFAHSSFCGSMIFCQSQSRSSEYVFIYHSKEVQLGWTYYDKTKYTKNHYIRIHVFLNLNLKKFHTKTSI